MLHSTVDMIIGHSEMSLYRQVELHVERQSLLTDCTQNNKLYFGINFT